MPIKLKQIACGSQAYRKWGTTNQTPPKSAGFPQFVENPAGAHPIDSLRLN